MIFIALLLITCANAHNWINSISRSASASTTTPVIPSSTNKPHATVAPGQKFQVEFMTGHGGYTYFYVQKLSDRRKLSLNSKKTAARLLETAAAAEDVPLRNEYRKHHRKMAMSRDAKQGTNLFASLVRHGEPGYITREVVFSGSLRDANQPGQHSMHAIFTEESVKSIVQAEYKDEHTVNDRRLTFHDKPHPEFPWLLEFRRYSMESGNALEMDVVLFDFPVGTPPGDYMVYYSFEGYYDAVDVRVVDTPPENIYGKPPPPEKKYEHPEYVRVDHCAFNVEQPIGACMVISSDMESCKISCNKKFYSQCTGVQIIPVTLPMKALNHSLYSEFWTDSETVDGGLCPRNLLNEAKPGDFICVPIFAKLPTETEQRFRVTDDPIAPEYYSTCHIRQRVVEDEEPMEKEVPERKWRKAQRECVSCKAAAAAQRREQLWVDWSLNPPQHCVNCDVESVDPASLPPVRNFTESIYPWKERLLDKKWDKKYNGVQYRDCGFPLLPGGYECHPRFDGRCDEKQCHSFCNLRCHLSYVGSPMGKSANLTPLDCAIAVQKEKFCSKKLIAYNYREDLQNVCQCYAASAEMSVPPAGTCCPPAGISNETTHGLTMLATLKDNFASMIPSGPLGGNDALL